MPTLTAWSDGENSDAMRKFGMQRHFGEGERGRELLYVWLMHV